MEITRYELKYCERCGTLKLRRVASESTYCRLCESLLSRFAFPRRADGASSSSLPAQIEANILGGMSQPSGSQALAGRVQ